MGLNDWLAPIAGFELSNLTLLVGVVVATVVRRVSGINPGGIIAAAVLILAAHTSLAWAVTIPLVGIVLAKIYSQFFGHIYHGRVPLFILAFMSVSVMIVIGVVMKQVGLIPPSDLSYPLGVILPAILAAAIRKQGLGITYAYTLLSVVITALVIAGVYQAGLALHYDFHQTDRLLEHRELIHIPWAGPLALASIAIGYLIYRWQGVKTAGYVVLPLLANLLVVSPLNFVLVVGLAVICYGLTSWLRRHTLIIGIGRYSLVLVMSILLVWTAEVILLHTTSNFSPFLGTSIFASLAIAVLVNENTIYGIRRAAPLLVVGTVAMTGVVLTLQLPFLLGPASGSESHVVRRLQADVTPSPSPLPHPKVRTTITRAHPKQQTVVSDY